MQIVKLTDTVGVSGQISPAEFPALAEAGYRVIVNNRPDGEALEQPSSAEFAAAAEAAGLEYHYYPLNAFNYPGDDVGAIARLFDDGERPVLAFCRSGTRSTNLWISSRAPEEQESAREHARSLGFDVSMSGR
ncbi:TIGR01244 family sulfur transferase [Pseudohaliea rubra]|uniref:Sulfide-quinone reductase n=1 Tax=Pseudohaliea rubra DSM 19751 TaxID=1265313 RepID=A0A095WW45_9GAMM|nr:TIGR01244 family sulfur transferase [Pseudohaliea rubra]KGE02874.1 Sulfide-quinone reductase [Pseudohaliea rubra DSM 19751]